jgi:hypothetical protein
VQQLSRTPRAPRGLAEEGSHVAEHRILIGRVVRQQLLAHDALDVLEPAAFARDAARHKLSQIRMSAGPDIDAIHQCLRELPLAAEGNG